jgi:hypothetical protein
VKVHVSEFTLDGPVDFIMQNRSLWFKNDGYSIGYQDILYDFKNKGYCLLRRRKSLMAM